MQRPDGTNLYTATIVWRKGAKWWVSAETRDSDYVIARAFLDTDGDKMPDVWEEEHGLNPTNVSDGTNDCDADGLANQDEFSNQTHPCVSDTDHDGSSDFHEVAALTDPLDGESYPVFISGTVSYEGGQTGSVEVIVSSSPRFMLMDAIVLEIPNPGQYTVSNLNSKLPLWVVGRMRLGTGVSPDFFPWGRYSIAPLFLNNSTSGIDIVLHDPVTVSGQISYGGDYTGEVDVLIRGYSDAWWRMTTMSSGPGFYAVSNVCGGDYCSVEAGPSGYVGLQGVYGNYTTNFIQFTNNATNVDFQIFDPVTISGDILYSGNRTGEFWASASRVSNVWSEHTFAVTHMPGPFTITNVPRSQIYWVRAFLDTPDNYNRTNDYWEPYGVYTSNPVLVTNDLSGVEMILNE